MPTRAEANAQLDNVRKQYFEAGDLERTLVGYEGILRWCEAENAEPDAFAMTCRDIADILYELGKKREAYQMYDQALGYPVKDTNLRAHVLLNKGISLMQDGKTQEALSMLEESVRLAKPPLSTLANANYQSALQAAHTGDKVYVDLRSDRQIFGQ